MNLRPIPVLASLLLATSFVGAGVVIQPTGASTNMGNFGTFEPIHAIDQSALAVPYISGVTDFPSYTATTGTVGGGSSFNTWFSSTSTTGHFDYDLGSAQTVDAFAYWADPQAQGQSVNAFTLSASNDPFFTSSTPLGSYTANDGLGNAFNAVNFAQIFDFSPVNARYIRMDILSNHGSTLTTGIVEGAFEGVVPEPASAGILISAGAMYLTSRRRAAKR